MSNRNNDELADALARLSAGEVDPNEASHHGQPAPSAAPAPPPPSPPPAARPKPQAPQSPAPPAKPIAGASARPSAPAVARTPAPSQPPAAPRRAAPARAATPGQAPQASKPNKPASPARPAMPGPARPAAPPAAAPARSARPTVPAPARPAAPMAAPVAKPAPPPEPESPEPPAATEDDDAVIVPAAPLEYLGHAPAAPHRHKPRSHKVDLDSMKFRRMTIPIFLTAGVLLFAAGALRFIVGTDAPLSDLPAWMAFVAWGAAIFMIGGAVMNMMRVKNQLARAERGEGR